MTKRGTSILYTKQSLYLLQQLIIFQMPQGHYTFQEYTTEFKHCPIPGQKEGKIFQQCLLLPPPLLTKAQVEICCPGSHRTKIECDGILEINVTLNLPTEHAMYTFCVFLMMNNCKKSVYTRKRRTLSTHSGSARNVSYSTQIP